MRPLGSSQAPGSRQPQPPVPNFDRLRSLGLVWCSRTSALVYFASRYVPWVDGEQRITGDFVMRPMSTFSAFVEVILSINRRSVVRGGLNARRVPRSHRYVGLVGRLVMIQTGRLTPSL